MDLDSLLRAANAWFESEAASRIITALVPALCGAGLGAYAAQRIAARNKEHDDLIKDVRAANAACTIAYSVTESFIATKRDVVKPLIDRYEAEKEKYEISKRNFIKGVSSPVAIITDLQVFAPHRVPIAALQDLLFKTISVPPRAISCLLALDRTVASLEAFHKTRNDLCEIFREKGVTAETYFGVETQHARDERYSSTLRNIVLYTDDALFLARLLGNDLSKHAMMLRARLPRKLRARAPVITIASYPKAEAIFPDSAKYSDWETMFVTLPKRKWWRFWETDKPSV